MKRDNRPEEARRTSLTQGGQQRSSFARICPLGALGALGSIGLRQRLTDQLHRRSAVAAEAPLRVAEADRRTRQQRSVAEPAGGGRRFAEGGERQRAGAGAVLGVAQPEQQAAARRVGNASGGQRSARAQVMARRLFVRLHRRRALGGARGIVDRLGAVTEVTKVAAAACGVIVVRQLREARREIGSEPVLEKLADFPVQPRPLRGRQILVDSIAHQRVPLTPRECARLMGYPDTFRIPVSDTQAYKLFSQAAVVPMIEATAKLMTSFIFPKESADVVAAMSSPQEIMATGRWTKEQVKLAFHLYCQLPYGRIHGRNPEIIALAKVIGRTSDAVAMKMLNIASLDPAITNTGRVGLGNASALDREIWDEFHSDWERLAVECQLLRQQLDQNTVEDFELENDELLPEDFTGETRQVLTTQRIKQHFFRRAVLSSYRGRCCMSGLSEPRLLIASHNETTLSIQSTVN